jgi:hypothetical protein
MPNGGILVSNTVARGRGRSNPSPIIDEEAARRAEKNNRIIAAAYALVKQYDGSGWKLSPAFSFATLGGRPVRPPPSDPRRQELERRLEARCLGEHPIYFSDRSRLPAALVTELLDWKVDDWSAAVIGMKYRLTAIATPPWGHAARSRLVIYRRQ